LPQRITSSAGERSATIPRSISASTPAWRAGFSTQRRGKKSALLRIALDFAWSITMRSQALRALFKSPAMAAVLPRPTRWAVALFSLHADCRGGEFPCHGQSSACRSVGEGTFAPFIEASNFCNSDMSLTMRPFYDAFVPRFAWPCGAGSSENSSSMRSVSLHARRFRLSVCNRQGRARRRRQYVYKSSAATPAGCTLAASSRSPISSAAGVEAA